MSYEIHNLRYIIFFIDSKYKEHDGRVFQKLQEAREFLCDYHESSFFTMAIIGSFVLQDAEYCNINLVETFGFPKDKKQISQLDMFK